MNDPYKASGVNYEVLDAHKHDAKACGAQTDGNVRRFGIEFLPWSRGESCSIFKLPGGDYIAFVVEGLGTKQKAADLFAKQLIAKKMPTLFPRKKFDFTGQDNTAMALNDLAVSGAQAAGYHQYLGVGSDAWFADQERVEALNLSTAMACNLARCVWAGGETPTNKTIVFEDSADLAGGAWGYIANEHRLINPANLQDGDAIVLVETDNPHANGYTLIRELAGALPDGYLTKLPDGRTFGEAVLAPTPLYGPVVQACLDSGIPIHYAVNITGHGWEKFMRAPQPFRYVVERVPERGVLYAFLQEHGPEGRIADWYMYRTFNMRAGFALIVPPVHAYRTLDVVRHCGFSAFIAGHLEAADRKEVLITPLGIRYE